MNKINLLELFEQAKKNPELIGMYYIEALDFIIKDMLSNIDLEILIKEYIKEIIHKNKN